MNIKDVSDQFSELVELQAYSNAQTKTIIDLTKKLKAAEDEVKHLKLLLDKSVPMLQPEGLKNSATDEETIARQQLYYLKLKSEKDELTLEEAKRVEIYTRMLTQINNSPKSLDAKAKNLKTEDLLALASSEVNVEPK